MKRMTILFGLLVTGATFAQTKVEEKQYPNFAVEIELYVDELTNNIKGIPVSFFDRPFSTQAWQTFISTATILVGAAAGHLTTCAITNLLGGNQLPSFFENPKNWSPALQIGTATGAALGGYAALKESYLGGMVNAIDKPLLIAVLNAEDNSVKLMRALDELNVSALFPRAMGFARLENLRSHLADIIDLFSVLTTQPYGNAIKELLPELRNCLAAVKNAMIMLKKDPRWYEECNAHSLSQTQAAVSAHQNAQLAAGIINLAHAASK